MAYKRMAISLMFLLVFSFLSGCGGKQPMSEEEMNEVAKRLDERLYPKLSGLIQQEFVQLRAELKKAHKPPFPIPTKPPTTKKPPVPPTKEPTKTVKAPPKEELVLSIQGGTKMTAQQFEDLFQHKTKLSAQPQWRNLSRKQIFDSVVNVALLATHAATHRLHEEEAFQHWSGTLISNEIINLLFSYAERALPPLTEKALKAQYEQTKALYKTQPYLTVYMIEVASKKEAEELRKELTENPETFQDVAKARSLHAASKRIGGKLDRIYPGILPKELYSKLKAAKINEILPPMQNQQGRFALYKVTAKHEAATSPFELVKGQVQRWVRERRRDQIFNNLEKQAKAAIPAEYDNELLASSDKPTDVLAKVKGIAITREQLEAALNQLKGKQKQQFSTAQGKRQLLQSLYRRALFYTFALQDESFNKRHGYYIDYLKREKLAQYYVQQKIRPSISITSAQVKEHYEKTKTRFKSKEPYLKARQCYFGAIEKTDEAFAAAKEKAKEVIKEVKGGASFAKLIKEKSQHKPTRASGGLTGWFSKTFGAFGTKFYEGARALKAGEITEEPVKADKPPGYFVIQLLDNSPYQPFDFVMNALKNELNQQKGKEKLQKLLEDIRKKGDVQINAKAIEELDKKNKMTFKTNLTEKNLPPKTSKDSRTMVLKAVKGPDGKMVLERDLKEESKLKDKPANGAAK